jgi:hypothetical protein
MHKLSLLTIFVAFVLLACGLFTPVPNPTAAPTVTLTQAATAIPSATLTTAPPATDFPASPTTETSISIPDPQVVAYDFVANICKAEWANSIGFLPTCPGDLDNIEPGYVSQTDLVFAESTTAVEAPALIVLPQQGATNTAIFGMYPAFEVWPGDQFRATIACQGDSPCDVEFALEYFDAAEDYQAPGWTWQHQMGDGPVEIALDLGALAGQTVKFVLALRSPQGDPVDDYALWIAPHIVRSPEAQPPSDQADQTPGVISGMVEMSTAPPYMNDPGKAESMPVVVVFFNLEDGTYWWIHTSLTGHPYFKMTVPPGSYQVLAYGQGVGDVPYVSAGHTGQNPSCGQALQSVVVEPNAEIENIIIADWNWACGGDAYRPDKPADIPLP